MSVIRRVVDSKRYSEKKYKELNDNLRTDIEKNINNLELSTAALATALLNSSQPLIPFEQALLQRGELVSAYRNLLEDHLRVKLYEVNKCDPWTHIYTLLNLPSEHRA